MTPRIASHIATRSALVVVFGLSLAGAVAAPAAAEDGVSDCPVYDIEGSIEPPTETGSTASVFLHIGAEPIAGQRVFATFTTADGDPVGEPVALTTGPDGRASTPVPSGATQVSFVAESPVDLVCSAGSEPNVALEIRPTGAGPVEPGTPSDPALARTGPVSAGVLASAVLVGAVGCGVWMGRGRRISRDGLVVSRG